MSASVITGAGTPSSIDSSAVQRPSPESATTGATRENSSPRARISAHRSSSQERTTLPWRQVSARRAGVDVELGTRREQREAFCERLHDPVLDAVVDHLGVVAGAARPAVQPAALGSGASSRANGWKISIDFGVPPSIRQ